MKDYTEYVTEFWFENKWNRSCFLTRDINEARNYRKNANVVYEKTRLVKRTITENIEEV